jgi:N-acetylneuraminic acid mutarotase
MSKSSSVATGWLDSRRLLFTLLLLAPLSFLSGCGSGQTNSGQTGSVPVNLAVSFPQSSASTASTSTIGSRVWAVVQRWIPTISSAWAVGTVNNLASLTVEVSAPDLLASITKTVPLSAPTSGQVITLTLDIPVGSNRIFTVSCLDATRVRIFKGNSSPVTLSGGQTATVDIALTAAGVAGPLTDLRGGHTATLLQNGQVLVVGGYNNGALASAELFDPVTKRWNPLAAGPFSPLETALIPLGDLLIPGAFFTLGDKQFDSFSLSVSSGPALDPLFPISIQGNTVNGQYGFAIISPNGVDTPIGETFISTLDFRVTALDPLRNIQRARSTLTLPGFTGFGSLTLESAFFSDAGRTISLGNLSVNNNFPTGSVTLSQGVQQLFVRLRFTEVGPVLGAPLTIQTTFTQAGDLTTARYFHTATLLQNGQVLVAGGYNNDSLDSAELFDPVTNTWSAVPRLTTRRDSHTATLLQNGQVLVVGGYVYDGSAFALDSAELFDPVTKTWSTVGGLTTARGLHTATLLQNGQVLVVGGIGSNINALASAEVFDPAKRTWSTVGGLTIPRGLHTATLLQNGQVLVVGGSQLGSTLASAELFDPTTNTWSIVGGLTDGRDAHTATLLQNGQVLAVGGFVLGGNVTSAELFDPATKTWSTLATGLTDARDFHTATLLQNSQILVVGGFNGLGNGFLSAGGNYLFAPNSFLASAELFDLSLR